MIRIVFCLAFSSCFAAALVCAEEAKEFTNSTGMKLVRIEPGSFMMGQDGPATDYRMTKHPEKFDDADWDEKPAHRVTITQPFYMGVTEVTVGQYRAFDPSFKTNLHEDDAVTSVSWEQAVKFSEWLSAKEGKTYRLPTEAEWEYACRAGATTLFHTGDALPEGFQPWSSDTGYRDRYFIGTKLPAPYRAEKAADLRVGRTKPNAWGLYDMHGNAAEWCADWYGPYEAGEQIDPVGRSAGDFRVFRGGHHSIFARLLRSANRGAWLPDTMNHKTGFRVVLGDVPKGKPLPPAKPPLYALHVRQEPARIEVKNPDMLVFQGPGSFVKIEPDSYGPLFITHNHSPCITECPNGDLLAVWYSCVDEGGSELTNVASRLRLGEITWEHASSFWDGVDVNDHGPKIWWDGKDTLYHFVRGRDENLIRTSSDNGVTWSKPVHAMPVGEFGNQVIRLNDGTLVITNDARHSSLVYSRDGGKTWKYNDTEKRPSDFRPGGRGLRYPGIHAPIVELADGRIMAISRNDRPNDQAKFDYVTPISYTSDLGKTWTYEKSEFPAISSVQRAAMIRLREGPIVVFSFTDQWRDWKNGKGMTFKREGNKEFTGYGMFGAVSFDDGKTWPVRRLITPGGKERSVNTIDRTMFTMSDTMAEPCGYLAATQTRDGNIQLITSKNHYVLNLAWLKQLPTIP
jgi:sulfatase modifying factor 1